jgi:hypothetical protein
MLKTISPSTRMIRLCMTFLLGLAVTASGFAADGEDPGTVCKHAAGNDPYVCFDHAHKVWIQPVGEITREGAPLKIVIINTDPGHIVATAKEAPEVKTQAQGILCKSESMVQTIFPKGEGRYTLEIAFDQKCDGLDSVAPVEFRVDVLGWEQSIAGGFIGSGHRNPQFSAYTRKINNADMTFVEEEPSNQRDDLRLGLSSFIHLYNERIDRWQDKGSWGRNLVPSGFSFGLGIGEQNRTMYSLGPAWRFGTKGFLSIGYSWAPVDRLPNGIRTCPRSNATCDPTLAISDPSRIATLSQHTKGAWFASLSYTFLTLGTFFQDRFQEAIKASSKPAEAKTQTSTTALTSDALELTCAPQSIKAGETVTLTATVKSDPGTTPLQLEMAELVNTPSQQELGSWVSTQCPAAATGKQCFKLEKAVIGKGFALMVKPKQAGAFKPKLSADKAEKSCEVVVQ